MEKEIKMKVLLTSGGTRAKIDDVRHVGNMSSGTFGNHICNALLDAGHEVVFLYAKGSKCPHELRVNLGKHAPVFTQTNLQEDIEFFDKHEFLYTPISYDDFEDYAKKLKDLLADKPDVVILAAAVSDYIPQKSEGKISSEFSTLDIHMIKAPKLINFVKDISPDSFLVGFKLLVNSTGDELIAAMEKQVQKTGADLVVGNDLRDIKANQHSLTIYNPKNHEILYFSNMSGHYLAKTLVAKISNIYKSKKEKEITSVSPYPQQMSNVFMPFDWAGAVGGEMLKNLGLEHGKKISGDIFDAMLVAHQHDLLVRTGIGNDCMMLFIDTPRGNFRQR